MKAQFINEIIEKEVFVSDDNVHFSREIDCINHEKAIGCDSIWVVTARGDFMRTVFNTWIFSTKALAESFMKEHNEEVTSVYEHFYISEMSVDSGVSKVPDIYIEEIKDERNE